jgi:hypothetical protein
VASGAAGPRSFTLSNMRARVAAKGDLWSDLL